MINLISLSKLIDFNSTGAVNLMIVRHLEGRIAGTTHFKRLAPSEELLSYYKENQTDEAWEIYKRVFEEEMMLTEAQIGLQVVKTMAEEGKIVNLICYCKDTTHCHRSLVSGYLERMGLVTNLF